MTGSTPKADHFAFQVSDLDRAIEFYTNQLGLKLLFREFDKEHHEAFAFLELDGGNLELLQLLDDENAPLPLPKKEIAPPYCPHLALGSDDLDRLLEDLRVKGVPVIKGPLEIAGTVKWLYIHDPDGNVLEYVQWL